MGGSLRGVGARARVCVCVCAGVLQVLIVHSTNIYLTFGMFEVMFSDQGLKSEAEEVRKRLHHFSSSIYQVETHPGKY